MIWRCSCLYDGGRESVVEYKSLTPRGDIRRDKHGASQKAHIVINIIAKKCDKSNSLLSVKGV